MSGSHQFSVDIQLSLERNLHVLILRFPFALNYVLNLTKHSCFFHFKRTPLRADIILKCKLSKMFLIPVPIMFDNAGSFMRLLVPPAGTWTLIHFMGRLHNHT